VLLDHPRRGVTEPEGEQNRVNGYLDLGELGLADRW
jgi:hypothetical protein